MASLTLHHVKVKMKFKTPVREVEFNKIRGFKIEGIRKKDS